MLRKLLLTFFVSLSILITKAQDSTAEKSSTKISGSLDAYYRFNFDNAKDQGSFNNWTSFTNSQNSFELGMASIKVEHSFGKAGAVLDLGFGKRAEEFSYNDRTFSIDGNGDPVSSPTLLAAIKQGFVYYSPSDKVKFTLGKFGTHIGYELLDPQLNRNYSMSYMFSYGPFFHTGLKADIAVSDNFSFMLGVSNPTDFSTASFAKKFFLAQIHGASSSGNLSAYLNYVGGKDMAGTTSHQFDAVVTGKVSDMFSVGYNGTVKTAKNGSADATFWGSALYFNLDPSSKCGFTLRGEYFDDKDGLTGLLGTSVLAATLSSNIKVGGLTIIPELRLDSAKDNFLFVKNSGELSKSTVSFLLAGVFSF
ncbi:MAG TPA: outer membrane beta-barrel protein [Chitinophagaceae bacterium]|nr:outer membrane beta-barrel protein [Chitinophagaceae bacterium]